MDGGKRIRGKMIEIYSKELDDPRKFGGTTPLEAELDDDMKNVSIEDFGKELATLMSNRKFSDSTKTRIIGVKLHSITFSIITERILEREDE